MQVIRFRAVLMVCFTRPMFLEQKASQFVYTFMFFYGDASRGQHNTTMVIAIPTYVRVMSFGWR